MGLLQRKSPVLGSHTALGWDWEPPLPVLQNLIEINSQRFASLRIYVLGGNKANAPSAEGFAHEPGQSRDEESDDFYGVPFGEAQLIPRCSSVLLGGDAPAFDWETKAKIMEFQRDPC